MSDEEFDDESVQSDNEDSIENYSENDDDEQSEDLEEEIYQPSEDDEQSDDETVEGEKDEEAPPEPDYKPKFLEEQRMNYLAQYHPEEIHKSFDEILKFLLPKHSTN